MLKKYSVFMTGLFVATFPVFAFAQNVVVETNKSVFHQGEEVKVTLRNNSPEKIFSIAASATPVFSIAYIERKNEINEWEKLSIRCEWPDCYVDFDGPAEIKPGQAVSFVWEPQYYSDGKYLSLGEGIYRAAITWQIRRGLDSKTWIWEETKTKEFQISQP